MQKIGQRELDDIREKEEKRLIKIAKNYENCIYIEATDVRHGGVLAYNIQKNTGVIYPCFHCGMFQDSVVYTKYNNILNIDFRYFPRGYDMFEKKKVIA